VNIDALYVKLVQAIQLDIKNHLNLLKKDQSEFFMPQQEQQQQQM
jgi:hypothetical protein